MGMPFKEISQKTGISIVHLSQINTGARHYDCNEKYPLQEKTRGSKLDKEQVQEIISLLKNSTQPYTAIAKLYNVAASTIKSVNIGRTHKIDGIKYPIRN